MTYVAEKACVTSSLSGASGESTDGSAVDSLSSPRLRLEWCGLGKLHSDSRVYAGGFARLAIPDSSQNQKTSICMYDFRFLRYVETVNSC